MNKMATAVRVTFPCPLVKMFGEASFGIVKEIITSLVEYIRIPTFDGLHLKFSNDTCRKSVTELSLILHSLPSLYRKL